MPNLVNAYVIYDGTTNTFVGDDGIQISINCERLQAYSPRPVWLKRLLAPGDGTEIIYEPTFAPSSAELLDVNTIPGFWIEQDDKDTMVDVTTIAAFQAACDACCGTVPAIIANLYGGNTPDFTPPTLATFCIFRLDDGGVNAISQVSLDYLDQILGGTVKLKSHITGVSHFTVQSFYSSIAPVGSDVISAGACSS
jgi:hypothetical protein